MHKLTWFIVIFSLLFLPTPIYLQADQTLPPFHKDSCNLQEAIELTLGHNPELLSLASEIKAADARIKQAGLWPNPTFEAESENFSGDNPGFHRSENTFTITQPFVLGSKIKYQKAIAKKDRQLLMLKYEAKKIDLILQAEHAFYDILLAKKNLAFAKETFQNAKKAYEFLTKKAKGKNSMQPQLLSAEIEVSKATLDVDTAKKDLEIAKKNLTILWGDPYGSIDKCMGSLDRKFNVPGYNELKTLLLECNPEVNALSLKAEKEDFFLRLAKSERIPDVDIGFGVKQFEEDNTYSFVAGIAVPLPLFNRNQGAIQEAMVNKKRTEIDGEYLKNSLLSELNETHRVFKTALQKVKLFKESILPKAEQYFTLTMKQYSRGEREYLELLNGERTLIDTKKSYIEALHILQHSVANLERLCCRRFHREKGEIF